MLNGQEKATLIYVGDPMCSWCYGFTSELDEAVIELGDEVDFELIMGGLRPYNKESMHDLKDFLKDHWAEVYARTGQKFSYDILEEKEIAYDTEPACRAVVTIKSIDPSITHSYFKSIQHSFYFQNKNPLDASTYVELAQKFGVNEEEFLQRFESEEMKLEVKNEFNYSSKLGATSFPSLILKYEDSYYLVSRGYSKSEVIIKNIREVISGNN
jgi:putative protein-disulfide isomerase